MRNKERIPIVMKIIPMYNFIQNNTGLSKLSGDLKLIVDHIEVNKQQIEEVWLKNPDWRLGQLLINKGFAPSQMGNLWFVEEDDWLIDEGYCNIEDIKFWGINYTKEMIKLPETQYKLLKDLEIDHIINIIKYFEDLGRQIEPNYLKYFNSRIKKDKKNVKTSTHK